MMMVHVLGGLPGDFQNSAACFATRRATCKTGLLADAFLIDKVCR